MDIGSTNGKLGEFTLSFCSFSFLTMLLSPLFPPLNAGKNPVWDKILRSQVVKWKLMVNSNLLRRRSHPVLTVRYEDLKTDTVAEVVRMLDFLEFPYSREEVEHRIREGFTQFYRNHTDSFDHFTTEQKIFVNGIIFDIVQKVQNSKYSALAGKLQKYVLR